MSHYDKIFDYQYKPPKNHFKKRCQYHQIKIGTLYKLNPTDKKIYEKSEECTVSYDRMIWIL